MSVLDAVEAALPNHVVRAAPRPPARRKRDHRCVQWNRLRFAKLCGIHRNTLQKVIRKSTELQALLGCKPYGGHIKPMTEDQAREAAAVAVRAAGLGFAFAPRLKLDACKECGRNDSPHHNYGLCGRCYSRAWRKKNGLNVQQHPRKWDPVRGGDACSICESSERRHHVHGMCAACSQWVRNRRLEGIDDKTMTKMTERRRRMARAGRLARGRPVIQRWESQSLRSETHVPSA